MAGLLSPSATIASTSRSRGLSRARSVSPGVRRRPARGAARLTSATRRTAAPGHRPRQRLALGEMQPGPGRELGDERRRQDLARPGAPPRSVRRLRRRGRSRRRPPSRPRRHAAPAPAAAPWPPRPRRAGRRRSAPRGPGRRSAAPARRSRRRTWLRSAAPLVRGLAEALDRLRPKRSVAREPPPPRPADVPTSSAASTRRGSACGGMPVRNSSIASTAASTSPVQSGWSRPGKLDEARAGDAPGEIAARFRLDPRIVGAVQDEGRHVDARQDRPQIDRGVHPGERDGGRRAARQPLEARPPGAEMRIGDPAGREVLSRPRRCPSSAPPRQ